MNLKELGKNENLLGKFNCKVCLIDFESLIQHLNKSKYCKDRCSPEELNELKERSKQRMSLKQKLWKQQNKDKVASHNSKYYENNHETINEQNKATYERKKQHERTLKRKLENNQSKKDQFTAFIESQKNKMVDCNQSNKNMFDTAVLGHIAKFRKKGIDQETEAMFKMFEKEGEKTFKTFEAKNKIGQQLFDDIRFEDTNCLEKIKTCSKDFDVECIQIEWDKLKAKHYSFLEKTAEAIGETFVCPSCSKDENGKLYRNCSRCQTNKWMHREKSKMIRKRKPIDFTMADLENGSDEEEFKIKIGSVDKKALPSRECTKNITYKTD